MYHVCTHVRPGDRSCLPGPVRKEQLTVSEVQCLDSIQYQVFDLRIALPEEKE